MKKQWSRVDVSCEENVVDYLAALIAEEFGVGVEITQGGIRFYLEEHYLPKDWEPMLQHVIDETCAVWHCAVAVRYTLSAIEDDNWADRWKEYFKPLRVAKHFIVVPTWEDVTLNEGDRVIFIDPGRAFGTGHHESTRLCLEWLESWAEIGGNLGEQSLLDVGTGSGILAIAGALLGFGRIKGIDNDPEAIEVARENLSLNALEGRVKLEVGTVEAPCEKYDVIVANIQAGPLIRMAESLVRSVKLGGRLALSGILLEQDQGVRAAYESKGLEFLSCKAAGEWCLMEFKG